MVTDNQFVATKLNLDKHYTLLDNRDITYLLNGDVEGYENSNQNYFVQNQKSNELCFQLEGYEFVGPGISVGSGEHVFFIRATEDNIEFPNSHVILADLNNCVYSTVVSGACLDFDPDFPVRGVWKYNSQLNTRTIYFVDGKNKNRFVHLDRPPVFEKITDDCETCERQYSEFVDCDALNINKSITIPCLDLTANTLGTLSPGTYQVGFAWSQNGTILSDFYFSDVIKAWNDRPNIGFTLDVECIDNNNIFDEYTLVLVSTTKEGSLVLYRLGNYSFPTNKVTITSLDNLTVVDLSVATSKRVKYDKSKHVATNGEILLFGDSQFNNVIPYQIQAIDIEVGWQEIKVPKKDAHKYPTLMRDEVYDLAIEWFHTNGQSLGQFPIPGRDYDSNWEYVDIQSETTTYKEFDVVPSGYNIYNQDGCISGEVSAWQITNTAYVLGDLGGTCGCNENERIGLYGKCGYYHTLDFTYPDEPDIWGELVCQPIRRHKMPPNNLTHIYDEGECQDIGLTFQVGLSEVEVTATVFTEGDCVNILGLTFDNITYPLDKDGNPIPDIYGFRILYAKRGSNKSVLHKGVVFSSFQETVDNNGTQEMILYPNYPYNDTSEDVYLNKTQTPNWDQAYLHQGPEGVTWKYLTYHSPDIFYKESRNEFGTELRIYTEEVGNISGSINKLNKHPEQSLNKTDGNVGADELFNYANQVNLNALFGQHTKLGFDLFQSFRVDNSQYLLPIKQFVGDNLKFNNYLRESSYFVEVHKDNMYSFRFENDRSRVLASELVTEDNVDDIIINPCTEVNGDILQGTTFYTAVKTYQPNQYGQVYSNTYVPLDACITPVAEFDESISGETFSFTGGDIYISKHSILRKMPLFTDWLFDVPFDTLVNYRDKRNVWFPRFWFDNQTLDYSVLYQIDNRYDDDGFVKGRFYTHVNGTSTFWCESEFIGDYREEDLRPNTQFYPKQELKELVKNERFRDQEIWLYDFSLLNDSVDQSRLSSLNNQLNALDSNYNIGDYIVHYSLKDDPQSIYDNWLTFLPLNYTVLPRTYGQFTGMHYIDQYSILFQFENGTLHSQEDYTLTINQGNSLFLAQGDIFTRRLRKWSNELTGYTGSVDSFFPINTRYGTLVYDRYRKTFFMWSDTLKPINDLKSFLNNFNDVSNVGYLNSMISVYDNLTDKIYITDKQRGWTISFSPKMEGFISFHSFVPDWYVPHHNTFFSVNNQGVWKHNADGYQNYYGTQYPFEVEFVIKQPMDQVLQDINLFTDYIDYEGYNQIVQRSDKFFNKAFVYNNKYSTGLLNLNLKDTNNPNESLVQNKETVGTAEVTQVRENEYRINKLENNQIDSPNITYTSNGVNYTLTNINQNRAPHQRSKLMGRWFKVHLIDDTNSESKILVQLNLSQVDESKK